jgi:hypothetical protein
MELYRYIRSIGTNFFDSKIILKKFTVILETEKGYWFNDYGKKRWVSKLSKKRYCYPTIEEAKINFIKRTKRCEKIQRINLEKTLNFLLLSKDL